MTTGNDPDLNLRNATAPRVAVVPSTVAPFFEGAIVAGGGVVSDLRDADAVIWSDKNDVKGLVRALEQNQNLRWVQLVSAGIEAVVPALDDRHIWTCAKQIYGDEVAELALALALAGLRGIGNYARRDTWTEQAGTSLFGRSVTILGAGGLAQSLVSLLKPFKCRVTVLRRSPERFPGAEFTGTLDDLSAVLPRTDVLFLTLALTPETEGVIGAAELKLLPAHAWIVNVARGAHIVTDDLVAALRHGLIAGAALDVTDPEPLPDGHDLWTIPNCIITPHTANTPEMAFPHLASRISENVMRFAAGEELLGLVDVDAAY